MSVMSVISYATVSIGSGLSDRETFCPDLSLVTDHYFFCFLGQREAGGARCFCVREAQCQVLFGPKGEKLKQTAAKV